MPAGMPAVVRSVNGTVAVAPAVTGADVPPPMPRSRTARVFHDVTSDGTGESMQIPPSLIAKRLSPQETGRAGSFWASASRAPTTTRYVYVAENGAPPAATGSPNRVMIGASVTAEVDVNCVDR